MLQMSCFIYAIFQVSVMVTFGVLEPQSRTLQNGIGLPDLQSCVKGLKYKICSFTQFFLNLLDFICANFSIAVLKSTSKSLSIDSFARLLLGSVTSCVCLVLETFWRSLSSPVY